MSRQTYTPHPYQHLITDHEINTQRCNVWAGMGLGKTVSTLTALEDLFMCGELTHPTLVLAPLRVARSTWPDEADKWDHFRNIEVQPIVGTAKQRLAALQNTNASVFTTNYDNLVWLVNHYGHAWPFDTVIADESTRLKSHRTRGGGLRAAALAKVAHRYVKRWVNLTGTPAPNGLLDLWGQNYFVDKGARLGATFTAFKNRWFDCKLAAHQQVAEGIPRVIVEPRPYAMEQIQQQLQDVTIALDPADWFDLQEPVHRVVRVDLPSKARQLYREMEKEYYIEIEGQGIEALSASAKQIKCLQIASGAVYTDEGNAWREIHDAKLQALDSIIAEAAGMPVLVTYHWKHDLYRIQKAFPRARVLDNNPQTIRDWNAGKIPILVSHPQSAGHGLNLQDGGNIIVFFSHWWDLEPHQQIIERIGPVRQMQAGHNRPVFIYHIIVDRTLDTVVLQRQETKRDRQDLLIEYFKKAA